MFSISMSRCFLYTYLEVYHGTLAAGLCRGPELCQAAICGFFFRHPHISRGEMKVPLID